MKSFSSIIWVVFATAVLISSCKKETTTISFSSLTEYYPLQVGKSLIYRLDSTTTPPFGASLQVISYLAKDSIESIFPDNQGRNSYRVFRYITDTLQTKDWQYISTYYITPTNQSIEVLDDNNLRFIKLHMPILEGFSWKGNKYIETISSSSNVSYLDDWDYTYQNCGMPITVMKGTLDSTITITQRDDTQPAGAFDPSSYQQRNYAVEVYAKGIGLVYKEFLHWTWQTTPPPAKYEDGSYGIKLTLVDFR